MGNFGERVLFLRVLVVGFEDLEIIESCALTLDWLDLVGKVVCLILGGFGGF